ncbi:arp2/3 complex-activating protein rickA-like [Schistocerca serialis cubense]|uniref:arp2/3 complex-activating protein rickA-like n=1 Tax=Schistocerca serialis cubense TaxID=2023355 RepID=UPI00214E8FDE|nr:arp2/3 complex-activating protein rickA-like [Schistocerca serialis cubense]
MVDADCHVYRPRQQGINQKPTEASGLGIPQTKYGLSLRKFNEEEEAYHGEEEDGDGGGGYDEIVSKELPPRLDMNKLVEQLIFLVGFENTGGRVVRAPPQCRRQPRQLLASPVPAGTRCVPAPGPPPPHLPGSDDKARPLAGALCPRPPPQMGQKAYVRDGELPAPHKRPPPAESAVEMGELGTPEPAFVGAAVLHTPLSPPPPPPCLPRPEAALRDFIGNLSSPLLSCPLLSTTASAPAMEREWLGCPAACCLANQPDSALCRPYSEREPRRTQRTPADAV